MTARSSGGVGAFYTEEDSKNQQIVDATDDQRRAHRGVPAVLRVRATALEYKELAVFGDVTFKLSDSFDVITGLRFAHNDQKFRQISGGVILVDRQRSG